MKLHFYSKRFYDMIMSSENIYLIPLDTDIHMICLNNEITRNAGGQSCTSLQMKHYVIYHLIPQHGAHKVRYKEFFTSVIYMSIDSFVLLGRFRPENNYK